MADDIPHDGAPPEVEFEAEFDSEAEREPLPLGLARGIRHFTDFATDTPADLLLREPNSHLLAVTVEWFTCPLPQGDSRAYRVCGATMARDWYDEFPIEVRDIVDEASFDLFCSRLTRVIASRPLLGALVKR
ncbi:hypothetical protein CsSME_00040600 [Camellia sinensis var. sinensis]